MKTFPSVVLAAAVLTTSAYAASAAPHGGIMPMTVAEAQLDNTATVIPSSETPNLFRSDIDVIQEKGVVLDPWEGFNRKVHSFNNIADKFILRPLAVGYAKVTPEPVQAGVSRFFDNLRMPATAVNQALQGRPVDAGVSLGRFAVNTTVGILGVFDPASLVGLSKRGDEDFGQTLANWGWSDSRYLVLPLLGPRTVRDAVAIVGDQPLSPIGQIQDSGAASAMQLVELVDVRTQMLPIDQFRRDAFDDYAFVRDAWSQRRQQLIRQEQETDRE